MLNQVRTNVKSQNQGNLFKPVIRKRDMDRDMYNDIEKVARECVEFSKEKYKNENEIANHLKKHLEDKYKDRDLCWHVIIGRNFGCNITYKQKVMAYFYVGQIGFLVFATPDV